MEKLVGASDPSACLGKLFEAVHKVIVEDELMSAQVPARDRWH